MQDALPNNQSNPDPHSDPHAGMQPNPLPTPPRNPDLRPASALPLSFTPTQAPTLIHVPILNNVPILNSAHKRAPPVPHSPEHGF